MTNEQQNSDSANQNSKLDQEVSAQPNQTGSTYPRLSSRERRMTNPERQCYVLKPGMAWNPLLNLPRNMPCPCQSGKKFKACHLNALPRAVPEDIAKNYNSAMKSGMKLNFTVEAPKRVEKEFMVMSDENGNADLSTAKEVT